MESRANPKPLKHFYRVYVVLSGALIAISYLQWLRADSGATSRWGNIFIYIYLCFFFGGAVYGLIYRWAIPKWKDDSVTGRNLAFVFCVLFGLWLTIAIPVDYPVPTQEISLQVIATGERNVESEGNEVWLSRVVDGNGNIIPQAEFSPGEGWEIREGLLFSSGMHENAVLTWSGKARQPVHLFFVSHPWSGVVEIRWNDQSQIIDLYDPAGKEAEVIVETVGNSPNLLSNIIFHLSVGYSIGLVLFVLATWLIFRKPLAATGNFPREAGPIKVGRWTWLLYALPMIAVWSFFLMVFWPGLMSPDSIDQWGQILSGKFNDIHPAFHTFYIWLVTRIYLSPASVAISQIIFMAMAVGLIMQEVTYWSVPLWLRIAITSIFTLMPANILMVITLWKDIPYTISVLLLWLIMLKMIRTKGEWINLPKNFIYLLIALIATAMFRHNGLFVSLLFIISLWFILPSLKKALLITTIIVVSFIAIKGPVYSLLKVEKAPSWVSYQVIMHQLAAFLANDKIESKSQIALLTDIQPINIWKRSYTCYTVIPIFNNDYFNPEYFDKYTNKYFDMWVDLAKENTHLLIDHQLCVTSIIWKIIQPIDGYTYTYPKGIIPNSYSLVSKSFFQSVSTNLWAIFENINKSSIYWVFWRPALYLYITLFSIIIASIRLNNRNILMLLVPSLANTLSMMVLIPAQDFRYQYPVYVIGILSPMLLFTKITSFKE